MPKDIRDTFEETRRALEDSLDGETLTSEQKKIISLALRFGYSAAFCSRTCDMNNSYNGAERYDKGYKKILESVEE